MTMQTTSLGPNSAHITHSAAETLSNIQTSIQAYITSAGWTLFDASAGTNQQVYQAPNDDGTTFKYVMLDYTVNNNSGIKMVAYETWDATGHTGTNPSANTIIPIGTFDLANGGDIYVMSNARWLIIVTKIGTTFGDWFGCVEFSKDLSFDGAPHHAMVSAEGLSGLLAQILTNGSENDNNWTVQFKGYSPCRTYSGSVGAGAEVVANVDSTYGSNAEIGNYAIYETGSRDIPSSKYPWCSDLYANEIAYIEGWLYTGYMAFIKTKSTRGRFYGLKLLGGAPKSMMDTVNVNVDSNSFHSVRGTSVVHNVLYYKAVIGNFSNNLNFVIPA